MSILRPWDCPATWQWARLGELTTVVGGGTPSTTNAKYWDGGDIPWITPADLSGYQGTRICEGARSITELGLRNSGARLLPVGTVLLSSRAPVGYVVIASQPVATNQGFKSYLPSDTLTSEYLYWYLKGNRQLLLELSSGTTFLELSGRNAAQVPIPVPPLAEQRRIVVAIEEHLSRLDAAVAGLERVKAMLPRYRAAVLKAAVEREGPTRHVPLGTLLREPLRNGHSSRRMLGAGGVRTLTLTAVTEGDFGPANTKLTSASPERVSDLWLEPGDVLIERSNTPDLVGTTRVYMGPRNYAIFPDLLIRARFDGSVDPRFAEIVLQTPRARAYFKGAAQGIAGSMPKISQPTIEKFDFPLLSSSEQTEVIETVECRLTAESTVSHDVESALARASALRQSILARAFRGELVPQDPSDEPAVALLERIRAERAGVVPVGKAQRVKMVAKHR